MTQKVQTITPRPARSAVDIPVRDRSVRIAVLLMRRDKAEDPVKLTGPVRNAVRAAFAHPRLAAALQTLQMDADRLIDAIVSRWESPGHQDDAHQHWMKSNGSMTVRWWVDRDDALSPEVKPA